MYISIEQLSRQTEGIETLVERCIGEKWIRIVEKGGVRYLSQTDIYKLRFILHLRSTGVTWEEIPRRLTSGNLYSVEVSGKR